MEFPATANTQREIFRDLFTQRRLKQFLPVLQSPIHPRALFRSFPRGDAEHAKFRRAGEHNRGKQLEIETTQQGQEPAWRLGSEENPIARITDKYECLERSGGSHRPSRISRLSSPSPPGASLRNISQDKFYENNRKIHEHRGLHPPRDATDGLLPRFSRYRRSSRRN